MAHPKWAPKKTQPSPKIYLPYPPPPPQIVNDLSLTRASVWLGEFLSSGIKVLPNVVHVLFREHSQQVKEIFLP